MAAKKKAKSKTKRKKPVKVAKKPGRTKVAKKPVAKKRPAKKPARTKVTRPQKTAPPPPPPPPGERIGVVTHYYGHLSVAVVKLESATLRVGDRIHIRGHTSDFSQPVESLQVGHAPGDEVGPNDDFGQKVIEHAREHDVVYKVK
jgi:hypothetical protein